VADKIPGFAGCRVVKGLGRPLFKRVLCKSAKSINQEMKRIVHILTALENFEKIKKFLVSSS
jgi:hypothetical protein